MARETNRLNALTVAKAKRPGMYPDGGGLYLQVSKSGAKSWAYRFMLQGRSREMGLGSLKSVTLAEARVKAAEARKLRTAGVDPIEAAKEGAAKAKLEASKAIAFRAAAESYIAAHKPSWRSEKHASQWENSLEAYAYPVLGTLPVQSVGVAQVMRVLEPIWSKKTETASRVRGRIEAVLDWATARGYRLGENPARWRGHLENLLPKRAKVQKTKHYSALPYGEIGAFAGLLRERQAVAARALEFLILTAARTGEIIGARWKEISIKEAGKETWTVPADRIKGGKEHRVPLSPRAVAILMEMKGEGEPKGENFVFPGGKAGEPLSNMALLSLLERMKRPDLTAHGFRSTFRDWCAERTNHPREVAEMALAHTVGDKVEAAYRRGDLFEKRRRLMNEWATYCATVAPAGEVVSFPTGAVA